MLGRSDPPAPKHRAPVRGLFSVATSRRNLIHLTQFRRLRGRRTRPTSHCSTGTRGGSDMNILVVEDEALVALLVQEIVEESGHVCVGPVGSLGEACALIDSCHVDAALLDIWLKNDEFVYPAARKLASRDVPFAFVSARAARSEE